MNIISSTWAFTCKRYPDDLIKKFKARFCARGDQQLKGIDSNCNVIPIEYNLLIAMFVSINNIYVE